MNTNNKLIILAILTLLSVASLIYLQTIKSDTKEQFTLYEKTANEIATIKKLKEYYGDKKSNKRKIYNIIEKYKVKTINKKEDKVSLEFTINKLTYKELDSLNNEILNSGIKILKLSIKRIDENHGEFFCKVMF